jgi:hypothetical protein
MRRFLLGTAAIALVLAGRADAQIGGNGTPNSTFVKPLGYCQFTAAGSAQLLSAVTPTATTTCTPPSRAAWASIVVETASIRWRDDGTAPTTAIGMLVNPTSTPTMTYNADFNKIQFIAVTGSPVVNISFYDGPGIP